MVGATSGDKITVVIVDDHTIVRQGLRTYLELQPDILVVGEAANGNEAMAIVRDNLPDIVLMDLVMPVMDGVDATRAITGISPSTRVDCADFVQRGRKSLRVDQGRRSGLFDEGRSAQ